MINFEKLPKEYTTDYIGSGFNASVYKLDEKTVFKKFNYRGKLEESCKNLSNMYSTTFVLPQELVYECGIFVGYIMEYINGNTLNELNENEDIYTFVKEVKRCEYDVSIASIYKYYCLDFKEENIMYTVDKKLKFIDTDFYYKDYSKDLYNRNLSSFNYAIVCPLMNPYSCEFIDSRLDHMRRLLIDGRIKPSTYYKEVLKVIKSVSSKDINTFKDAKEGLQLLLK